ncbi:RNA polymerase sigma-70 factor [Chitinophaga sp. GCM10012297]|uniref:RNA polymerase sigma-70 factor n=1 Tax=Chitinophaga chungangae TaxID=2821488 RepID=A0ABS3YHD8_9BACT|nr:RNA polymerase sigma-70 factor [Chitinophaga chungangae]MBO9153698.1 RNA polymerase sigma-70 factor [Chitinophaga chungangae]
MKTEHSYQSYTDIELIKQVTQDHEPAFNELFARYRNRLHAYLVKVCKSPETAEEIVLDIFVKIWNGRINMGKVENMEAFLFTVARNKALDFLRQVKKSRQKQEALWERMQGNTAGSADQRLLLENLESGIRDAAAGLSPQRKMVFLLSRDHHLTYEQIAEKLQLSSNTVRNHLSAALQVIRAHISPGLDLIVLVILMGQ